MGEQMPRGPMLGPVWRTSPWDGRDHAYREFGEVVSEALCSHSSRTSALSTRNGRKCLACLLILGDQLAEVHVYRDRYQA